MSSRLLNEYHDLVDLELIDSLSPAQRERLREVEQALDTAEQKSPETRQMFARMQKTSNKLDQLLAAVQKLPKAQMGE